MIAASALFISAISHFHCIAPPAMTALHDLPAHDLLDSLPPERTLSPVEITQAVLAHMERWEPHIRATWLAAA